MIVGEGKGRMAARFEKLPLRISNLQLVYSVSGNLMSVGDLHAGGF